MPSPVPAYDLLLTRLHRRARRLTHCHEDAEDMAQEAALRLWQSARAGTDIANPEAYAMTALGNLARTRWRNPPLTQELCDDIAASPPDALRRIACAELCAAVAELPAAQSALLALVAAGETSPAELARLTRAPVGTVMSRLARARAALRARMYLEKSASCTALYAAPGEV